MVTRIRLLQHRLKEYWRFSLSRDHENLTTIYIVALSSIAAITLMFQLCKSQIHANQLNAVNSIRYIDRQAAESEGLYGEIVDLQITVNPARLNSKIESVEKEFTRLSEKHEKLLNLIESSYECPPEACSPFFTSQPFHSFGHKNGSIQNNFTSGGLEKLLESLKKYQLFLSQAGNYYDKQAKNNIHEIIFLDRLFCVLLLILLIVQAVFIFRPAVKKLNEALSSRSDFISRISHEIRNPMNSILGMAEILKSTNLSTEQNQYLDHLQRSGVVLLDMLNNLVDFSSLDKSKVKLKNSRFNLLKMVDKTTNIVSIQAHDKGLELFIAVDPNLPIKLIGDALRLEQVLINLLNNALKFTSKGYIFLNISKINDLSENEIFLRFSVQDTGMGIDNNKIENIFQSFVQEDSSIKRRFGGSGLGLSISKEIVELMGSKIMVESEKGKGSEFYFDVALGQIPEIKKTSFIPDKNIILFTEFDQQTPHFKSIKASVRKAILCNTTAELKQIMERLEEPYEILVDDSIGIINMINAMSKIQRIPQIKEVYALIRSNFPKENMDLIRKNGFRKFIIKPFRHWHLLGSENDFNLNFDSTNNLENKITENEMKQKRIKVLAVDDANDNLFLLKELLKPLTNRIDFANNGLEAINLMADNKYDIVFMDIQMPIMDGYTAIRKMRQSHKMTPIFAVTAHAGLVEEKKCLDAGFTERLTKPINRRKLYKVFEETFGINFSNSQKTEAVIEKELSPDEKIIQKLLPEYFKSREEDIKKLERAIIDKDFDVIKRIGHRVKGSAKSYGFEFVGNLSTKLEDAAEAQDLKVCQQLILEIKKIVLLAKDKHKSKSLSQNH